ncbi:MAG: acetylornithine deacetylase, partial [Bacteroidaceae bacterium]|nr:acetylornithine deacetylase [Bacteroidaceae bacterium]
MIDYTEQAVELLKQMISIPSPSRNEEQVADMLYLHLQSLGLDPKRVGNNLYCIAVGYDENRPTILLDGHIDTVKPTSAWTRDPFVPTVEDG